MDEKDIVKYVVDCRKEAEDARADIERQWSAAWDAYNCKQDYSEKREWQARVFIPKAFTHVEQATAAIKRALMYHPNMAFFSVEPVLQAEMERAKLVEKLLRFWFHRSHFVDRFVDACRIAFITGYGALKLHWEVRTEQAIERQEVEGKPLVGAARRASGEFVVSVVDPFNMFLDPMPPAEGAERYRIERYWTDLSAVREMGDAGVYQNTDDVVSDYDDASYAKQMQRLGLKTDTGTRKKCLIYEFWGNVYDKDGTLVEENRLITVANERHLLRDVPNPFLHGRPPYIDICPKPFPGRRYGTSLIVPGLKLQWAMNNLANMVIDAMNYAVLKIYELDISRIQNPEDLQYLEPGDIIKVMGGATPALRPLFTGENSGIQLAMALFAALEREFEEVTGVTEFFKGAPTSKGRPTAREVALKTAQAQGVFDNIARELEARALVPALERSYQTILQFMDDFSSPAMAEILGDDAQRLALMDADARRAYIFGNYRFTAAGISIVLSREEMMEKLTTLLTLIAKDPMLIQIPRIRLTLLEKIIQTLNIGKLRDFIPEEVIQQMSGSPQAGQPLPQGQQAASSQAMLAKLLRGG